MPVDQERTVDPDFEREKWMADIQLREREIKLKENELQFKLREERRSRWANPLVLAVLAAALAAAGNATVAYVNGSEQRALEQTRGDQQLEVERRKASAQEQIEETKAEATRILEAIKTDDRAKAIGNLQFMLDAGLITNDSRRTAMFAYLGNLKPGQGPVLPGSSPSPFIQSEKIMADCSLPAGSADVAKLGAAFGQSLMSNPLNLRVKTSPGKDGMIYLDADDSPQNNLRFDAALRKDRETISIRWAASYQASGDPTKQAVPVGRLSQTLLDLLKKTLETQGAASATCGTDITAR
jgi:hypothetical protein